MSFSQVGDDTCFLDICLDGPLLFNQNLMNKSYNNYIICIIIYMRYLYALQIYKKKFISLISSK